MNMAAHVALIVALVIVICNQSCYCLQRNVAESFVSDVLQPIEHDFTPKEIDSRLISPKKNEYISAKNTKEIHAEQENIIHHLVSETVKNANKKLPSRLTSIHRVIRQVNARNSRIYPQLNTSSPYVTPYPGSYYQSSNQQWGSRGNYNYTRPDHSQYSVTPGNSSSSPSIDLRSNIGSYPQGPKNYNRASYPSYPSHTQATTKYNFTAHNASVNSFYNTPLPAHSMPNTHFPNYNNFNRTSPDQHNPSTHFGSSRPNGYRYNATNYQPGLNNSYRNTNMVSTTNTRLPLGNGLNGSFNPNSSHPNSFQGSTNLMSHSPQPYPYNRFNNSQSGRNDFQSGYPDFQTNGQNFSHNSFNNPYGQTFPATTSHSQTPSPLNTNPSYGQYYPNQNLGNSQNTGYNTSFRNAQQGQSNWNPAPPYSSNMPYQPHSNADRNYFHYPTNYNSTDYDPRKVPSQRFSY